MSFLKRIGSVRKKGTYNLAANGPDKKRSSQALSESAATRTPSGLIQCHVTLLDDSSFTCEMNKHSLGCTLLDEVLRHVDVVERDYFGLAYSEGGLMKWLDTEKSLKKQFRGHHHSMVLEFRVKFYASDPINLQEELTKYLFFRQIKKDLLDNRLHCSSEAAAVLSGYALQAEIGDYSPISHPHGYVSEFRFIQRQDPVFEQRVATIHQEIRGQTTAEAEFNFLRYAKQLEFYGVEQYPALDDRGFSISLGVCAHGIIIFKDNLKFGSFSWPEVLKITYSRRKFFVELRPSLNGNTEGKFVGFHMTTPDSSKRLWKTCIEHHAFFRMSAIKQTPQRSSPFRKSRMRIIRRTERQVVEDSKITVRDTMPIRRTPSKRYPRRIRLSEEGDVTSIRPRASTEITRSESLRVRSRPVFPSDAKRIQSPPLGDLTPVRRYSATRDMTPSINSPRTPSEADDDSEITGQFELEKTEAVGLTMLNFTNHLMKDNGENDLEYYDELNAAEELAGQLTMDDLASEGFLLIRLDADEGRYGFHVKGGVDYNLPVFISKVKENSPASLCQPPLQEGDQVLFINGLSTENVLHSEVIGAIKQSLDRPPPQLSIIVKPQDLSRVEPLSQESGVKTSAHDPASVLRESIRDLKQAINGNSLVLQFDRLYKKKPGMLTIASKLPQNLSKNRFRDVTAYDVTRVHLLDGAVDYINANYINMEVPSTGQIVRYIATQGPMQNTCIDFWQMVWEQGCKMIVMLTAIVEAGKVKCCRYWPDQNSSIEFGPFEILCTVERNDDLCTTRHFVLRNNKNKEEREIIHMQYEDWPEYNLPRTKADFLRFVRRLHSYREGSDDPILAHCSGGVDRTGLLIAMETALLKMEIVERVDPLEIVRSMRDKRGMMLPAVNQYRFLCECVVRAYEEDYVEIDISSSGSNRVI